MDLSTQRLTGARVFYRLCAGLAAVLFLAGCQKEGIHVYTVPKERAVERASAAEPRLDSGAPHIHYKTPAGWVEARPGGIRVARFLVPAKQGGEIDVSVIPLPGITASKAEVVNMWRDQIKLGPIKEDELDGIIERVKVGSEDGEMFDIVSTGAMIEDRFKARILVAMLGQGQTTWFFKMMGEDESVRAQKAAFVQFLSSVEFDSSDHGAGSPRFTSTNAKEVPGARGESGAGSRPGWEVPSGWQEVPPTQMLLARFVMPDKEEPKAEVTVSVFPGDAGGLLPNINRWRRQIKLDPVQSDSLQQMTTALDVLGGKAILVDMSGQNPTNGQPTRIIAAILPKGERTWFYKLMGNEQVAEREKAAFIKFVQTATHPNG